MALWQKELCCPKVRPHNFRIVRILNNLLVILLTHLFEFIQKIHVFFHSILRGPTKSYRQMTKEEFDAYQNPYPLNQYGAKPTRPQKRGFIVRTLAGRQLSHNNLVTIFIELIRFNCFVFVLSRIFSHSFERNVAAKFSCRE